MRLQDVMKKYCIYIKEYIFLFSRIMILEKLIISEHKLLHEQNISDISIYIQISQYCFNTIVA